jgi:hypothetical protein
MPDTAIEAVLKAWRNALIGSTTLTTLIPAAKIYIGPRRADEPVPAIAITISEGRSASTQGVTQSKLGYLENAEAHLKIELEGKIGDIILIYTAIYEVVLKANSSLSTIAKQIVKVRKEEEIYNERGLLEGNIYFGFSYIWQFN